MDGDPGWWWMMIDEDDGWPQSVWAVETIKFEGIRCFQWSDEIRCEKLYLFVHTTPPETSFELSYDPNIMLMDDDGWWWMMDDGGGEERGREAGRHIPAATHTIHIYIERER